MPDFNFRHVTTITITRLLSVYADDEQTAHIKASCGPISHIREKEGVEVSDEQTDEHTAVTLDTSREDRLDAISRLADEYAKLDHIERPAGRSPERTARILEMLSTARTFTFEEMAYFCQQLMSHYSDHNKATMALTVFTNRLKK